MPIVMQSTTSPVTITGTSKLTLSQGDIPALTTSGLFINHMSYGNYSQVDHKGGVRGTVNCTPFSISLEDAQSKTLGELELAASKRMVFDQLHFYFIDTKENKLYCSMYLCLFKAIFTGFGNQTQSQAGESHTGVQFNLSYRGFTKQSFTLDDAGTVENGPNFNMNIPKSAVASGLVTALAA